MIRLVLCFLVLSSTASIANSSINQPFQSIVDVDSKDTGYVVDRCESFRIAIFIFRQIMQSNPVHGRDASRGAEFDWIEHLQFSKPLQAAVAAREDRAVQYLDEYTEAFGSVTVPTNVPNLLLYQSDKATCLRLFKSEDLE